MALSCGCEVSPGLPVTTAWLKEHYKHTFEALLIWELIVLKDGLSNYDDDGIGSLRSKYIAALAKRFPAAAGDI